MSDFKAQFDRAVATAQTLATKPDNTTLLKLYGLYKQATLGDAKGERPSSIDVVGAAKFDAWEHEKGTSTEAAQTAYVALITRLKAS